MVFIITGFSKGEYG